MKRILLVDDDFHLRRSLEAGLQSLGYAVTAAEDAIEAMQLIEKNVYDVVVTDVLMPGPSGFDLAEQVHAIKPKLPVILMTANDQRSSLWNQENGEAAWQDTADEIIPEKKRRGEFPVPLLKKPFVLSDLVNLFEPAVKVRTTITKRL